MVVWVHLSCIHVKLFYSPYLCHSCFTWQEQVPVQVHRSLAYSDGIRLVEPARMAVAAGLSDGLLFTELDKYSRRRVRIIQYL